MAKQKLIKRIDTIDGPLQIDYNALANLPDIGKLEEDVEALKASQIPESTIEDLNKEVRKLEASIGYAATDPDKTFAEAIDETFVKKTELEEILEDLPTGGGASSWNDLTDKPFEEQEVTIRIDWDGSDEGKTVVGPFVKVNDKTPSTEELIGGTIILSNGQTGPLNGEIIYEQFGLIMLGGLGMIVPTTTKVEGLVFEPGVWFYQEGELYIQSMSFTHNIIKTLDPKYIDYSWSHITDKPAIVLKEDLPCGETYEETELVSNLTYEEYSNGTRPACNFVVGESYTVIWEGVRYDNVVCQLSGGYRMLGGGTYPFCIDDDGGNSLYIESDFTTPLTILGMELVIKLLDKKYLPEHKHSWKDLTNKPFTETLGNETITWDGNMQDSNPQFPYPEASRFYKVSDKIFTIDDLSTLSFTVYDNNSNANFPVTENVKYDIVDVGVTFIYGDASGLLAAVLIENNAVGQPEGTYFHYRTGFGSWYTSSITFPGVVETIDERVIPDTIARVGAVPHPDWNQEDETSVDYIKNKPFVTRDSIVLIDVGNGFSYTIQMVNGNLVSYCATETIEVVTLPSKTVYKQGEKFDPTGMVVMIVGYDGSKRETTNFIYPTDWLMETGENVAVEIVYQESEKVFKTNAIITVTPFEPETELIDFSYTANDDGTYTLTGWKGTYNGNSSTEMIIPEHPLVIL